MEITAQFHSYFQSGKIAFIYHYEEDETAMVVPAELLNLSQLRDFMEFAASDVTVAIEKEIAEACGVYNNVEIMKEALPAFPLLAKLLKNSSNFGGSYDYVKEDTGSSDNENILLINRLGEIAKSKQYSQFASDFKTPGHIKFYIAQAPLLEKRTGHTDLSVALMKLAGFPGVAAMASMRDPQNGKMLVKAKAQEYAQRHGHLFIEEKDVIALYKQITQQR